MARSFCTTLLAPLSYLSLTAALALGISGQEAFAQTPTPVQPAKAAAPGSPKLVGTWEGPFATDGPTGTMNVVIAVVADRWNVTNQLTSGDAPPAGALSGVQLDGKSIAWVQIFGEFEVHFKGTLSADDAKLDGTLEAFQGGGQVGAGTFSLARK